jgi:four helix bundle protein
MKVKSYKELNVWNKGIDIADRRYNLTENFPNQERYGIATQMQRAAVSISSNIAEGFVRHYRKEYEQFLYIALGSCAEIYTQLIICVRRRYLNQKELEELQNEIECESRMLMNLIKSIHQINNDKHSMTKGSPKIVEGQPTTND